MTAIDIDALIAAMRRPGPVDNHGPDHEPDDYHTQREIDQRGDEAADAYDTWLDQIGEQP